MSAATNPYTPGGGSKVQQGVNAISLGNKLFNQPTPDNRPQEWDWTFQMINFLYDNIENTINEGVRKAAGRTISAQTVQAFIQSVDTAIHRNVQEALAENPASHQFLSSKRSALESDLKAYARAYLDYKYRGAASPSRNYSVLPKRPSGDGKGAPDLSSTAVQAATGIVSGTAIALGAGAPVMPSTGVNDSTLSGGSRMATSRSIPIADPSGSSTASFLGNSKTLIYVFVALIVVYILYAVVTGKGIGPLTGK